MTSSYKEIYMQHILQKITILIMYIFITQRLQNIIIHNYQHYLVHEKYYLIYLHIWNCRVS